MTEVNINQILRLNDVIAITGLSRSTIYAYIERDEFPKPIKLGLRAVGWLASDIQNWIQERIQKQVA